MGLNCFRVPECDRRPIHHKGLIIRLIRLNYSACVVSKACLLRGDNETMSGRVNGQIFHSLIYVLARVSKNAIYAAVGKCTACMACFVKDTP